MDATRSSPSPPTTSSYFPWIELACRRQNLLGRTRQCLEGARDATGRCDDGRVRLRLLALAALLSTPVARAQSGPPTAQAATQASSSKQRLAELLLLGKRKDAIAVNEVAHRLVTDRDPVNRRVAALVLGGIVDAATDSAALGAAITALETAALHDVDPRVQASAAHALPTLKNIVALRVARSVGAVVAKAPSPPANPVSELASRARVGGSACHTAAPAIVGAENLTQRNVDLCDAFEHAASRVAWPSALSTSNGFALRVTLTQLDVSRDRTLRCQLSITTFSQAATLHVVSGSALVSLDPSDRGNREAERDCLEAVVESLLVNKVVSALQAPSSPAGPSSSSAPGTAAPVGAPSSPGSSTPAPHTAD
jgi:hypothetical protein